MKGKTYYYTDPLRDDFAGTNIRKKPLPDDYEYVKRSKFRRGWAWFLHHVLVTPLCFLYLKLAFGQKIVGRKKLRPYRKSGYFLYGNHTRKLADAFTPTAVSFPRKPYLIVNSDAVSVRGCKHLTEDLGGMPLPDSWTLQKKFCAALERRAERGVVAIYPEAHIWPLYTGVRPFGSVSFSYPVNLEKPCFTFTATYRKRKPFGGVKSVVYIDGPFFPDQTLSKRERKEDLRDRVLAAMRSRTELSTYSPNRFLPSE